jgi:prophage DNA circulation protein
MPWRERLQPASFRGIPFKVESSDISTGRRVETHEFPYRDTPYTEDLGRKARTFNMRAYLVGDNFDQETDQLIDAMETYGVGTLIHPRYGSLQVVPSDCRSNYDDQIGRVEYLDLTFIEHGKIKTPVSKVQLSAVILTKSDTLQTTVSKTFRQNFTLSKMPEFLAQDATLVSSAAFQHGVNAVNAQPTDSILKSGWQKNILQFQTDLSAKIRNPQTLGDTGLQLMASAQALFPVALNAYRMYRQLFDFGQGFPFIPLTTSTRRAQAKNRDLVINLVKHSALLGMARTSVDIDFDSYDDAVLIRNEIANAFDSEILKLGKTDNDTLFKQLEDLRSSVVIDITQRAGSLERIKKVQLQSAIPALLFSHQQYQTSERAEDLITRNKIRHPGFVPASKDLQVLV